MTGKYTGRAHQMSTTTESIKKGWETVEEVVTTNLDEIQAAPSHRELYALAKEHKLDTKSLFPKYKTILKKHGVDYAKLRSASRVADAQAVATAAESAPELALFAAGFDAGDQGSYAVCDQAGQPLWFGAFFDSDSDFTAGDAESADFAAAKKAIWLAGRAREDSGEAALNLTLTVSRPDMDDDVLTAAATRAKVALSLEIADDNPAIDQCQEPGFKTWREVNLADLVAGGEQ